MPQFNKHGFTLVELLVVMVILGILSTVGFALFTSVQSRARDAKVAADFRMIQKMITQATIGGKYLKDITGSQCTICVCRYNDGVTNMTDPSQNATCITRLNENWNKILNAGGYPNDTTPLPVDPYGNLYGWDENEGEIAPGWNPTGCENPDRISSAGPNHSFGEPTGYDDKNYSLQRSVCK
jgi:prepilin-type N-terminal cleavage/methylation domain-containing protein